jgi:hypothetical protein
MAKKPRTPPPPRRVQAPKHRPGQSNRPTVGDLAGRQRMILYAVALSGVVALVIVVAVIALGGGSNSAKEAAKTLVAAGCTYKHYPAQPRSPHYTSLTPSPKPSWNSYPPSSGRHYYQPLVFGIYTEPVHEIQAVHNLEHGAMILQYGDKVSKADVAAITNWYQKDANAVVVAPLPNLGAKVAFTAWTQWAECTGFNQKAADAFRSAFRYHAPESGVFPKSALQPGL